MEWNPKEVVLIYNFEKRQGRESLAYASQVASNVREIDISKNPLTESQMGELLINLGVGVEELIDKTSTTYLQEYEDTEMTTEDWLSVLKHKPDLMKTPIGILGKKAIICDSPGDILKLDDGQGFDQNMIT